MQPAPTTTGEHDGGAARTTRTGTSDRSTASTSATTSATTTTGAGRTVDRDAAERILRRAVELDDAPADHGRGISERALLEAAQELGIDAAEVQRAIAEEELGLLSRGSRPGDAFLGPDRFLAARVVDGEPAAVLDRVDAWLRRGGALRRVRRQDGWADYSRRKDPMAAVQRAARSVNGEERLAHVRRLRVVAAPAGEGRTLVGLVVDVSRSRDAAAAGGVTVAATGIMTAGAAAVTWVPWAWLGVPVAVAGGVGVMAARKGYVADVDDELEAVLDLVSGGDAPPSTFDGLASRLLRSSSRS
jgi:hypothetical protein